MISLLVICIYIGDILMKEIWKLLVYRNKHSTYEISDMGRIRAVRYGNYKILKFEFHRGYPSIRINRKRYKIHRLVLEAFLGLRCVGMEASHLDGNKLNNCLND